MGILGSKGVLGSLAADDFPSTVACMPSIMGHFVRIRHDTPEMPQFLELSAEPFNSSQKQDEAPP